MAEKNQCKNCEKLSDASYEFCPYCGQETSDKLTVGVLFSNTIRNYFSVDARFFKSFFPLIFKPGVLARRFVDGKRLKYLHPAQFYLFISIIFFFIFSFTVREADSRMTKQFQEGLSSESQADSDLLGSISEEVQQNELGIENEGNDEWNTVKVSGFQTTVLDSLIEEGAAESDKLRAMGMEDDAGVFTTKVYVQILKLYERKGGGILKTLFDTIPIAMFFMLPLFALLLKLFYYKSGVFAHHMVFSFNFFTFLFTTFSVLALLNAFLAIPTWVNATVLVSCLLYLTLALQHFYNRPFLRSLYKASFVSILYMMVVVPISIIGIVFVSFLVY